MPCLEIGTIGGGTNIPYQAEYLNYMGVKDDSKKLAEILIGPYLECIVAPSYSNEALNVLKKKKNLRVISLDPNYEESPVSIRSISGVYLYPSKDFLNFSLPPCSRKCFLSSIT